MVVAEAPDDDYGNVMPTRDLLVLAGMVSETLERHGLVACGRREDGIARVDFWTRDGLAYRHVLNDEEAAVDDVVAACLAEAKVSAPPPRATSHLN
jgi:hypothetical protein